MDNKTMMQYFEWYLPNNSMHWERCIVQAKSLSEAGINMVWLPPAYKGAAADKSVGYDVYDTYDLGEFERKGTTLTKYGSRDQYLCAVEVFRSQGIEVLADVVLNHMMGADDKETVMAMEDNPLDRTEEICAEREICAWTKFSFPNRNGKYSEFKWDYTNFSGTDRDELTKSNGIFRFKGKNWVIKTDDEFGNFDYLMGANVDMKNPETVKAVTDWGKWYLDTVHMDGFRLDAVKHIDFDFYREWLKNMREHAGKSFFAVGEYWSGDSDKLLHYLDVVEDSMSLFDVPLHFEMFNAANSNGNYDMGSIMKNSLVRLRPEKAVTFVDNHDTQPGQALCSFIPSWFKPIAYALILLQKEGIPCVFYGDYYGIPHDNIPPVANLKKLIYLRKKYAYGEQTDYFNDRSIVGFTRLGDDEHENSGLAVLMTISHFGTKTMCMGEKFANKFMYNIM
ncbi:MAG: alpha-amylase, partial [Lachnospiraceae bacterium]|nr:alpha-amylase [Lachnospiraceae bacterium]